MKLRVEMAEHPELRDKLMDDLDNMSRLVREGIAYARSSESLEETSLKLELNAWINSIACDYQDIGKNVQFQAGESRLPIVTRPQALRRVMTNLLDNALKFGERAAIAIDVSLDSEVIIHIMDDGPGYRWNRTGSGNCCATDRTAGRQVEAGEPRRGRAGCLRYAPTTLIVWLCICLPGRYRARQNPRFYTYPEHIRTMK